MGSVVGFWGMGEHSTIARRRDPLWRMLAARRCMAALLLLAVVPAQAAQGLDLQGHRGARGLAPENTLAAFATALGIGATTLELDLGVSRDGVVVVTHEPRLNPSLTRAPDGQWLAPPGTALIDLDLEAIQSFDVGRIKPGSRYAARFLHQRPHDGARIPTLAEVVALTRNAGNDQVRFNVETKLSPLEPDRTLAPAAFAGKVVEALRRGGIAARTTIQSFDWRSLAAVRSLAPEITTACLTAERSWLDNLARGEAGASPWLAGHDADDFESVPTLVAASGCEVWSPFGGDLSPAALATAHTLDLQVLVWTINDPSEMAALIDLGVDGIITDYPDRLRTVMAERGLALPPATPASP
jgi:glycerophosphoryl diester phosphodiesterase